MGRSLAGALLCLLAVSPLLSASSPEEKKATRIEKELTKINLIAAVPEGRRVVNRTMAEQLGVSREQLVQDRTRADFVYGELFGAYELAHLTGLTLDQVAAQTKQGRSLLETARQHGADLEAVLVDVKKLSQNIEKALNRVASRFDDERVIDRAAGYDPFYDSLRGDTAGFTPAQVAEAAQAVHNPRSRLAASALIGDEVPKDRGAETYHDLIAQHKCVLFSK